MTAQSVRRLEAEDVTRLVLGMTVALVLMAAGAQAQELVAGEAVVVPDPSEPVEFRFVAPTLTGPEGAQLDASQVAVDAATPAEAPEPGPPGMVLGVVTQTIGVPLILQQVVGTASSPLAAVIVRNPTATSMTGVTLAVTFTPPGEPPRRRLLHVAATLPADASTRIGVTRSVAARLLAGRIGALEVALAGATAADGTVWIGSPGPAFVTGDTPVACADAGWNAHLPGTDAPDELTGGIVRCAPDGRWLPLSEDRR
ncbi:MAG TPA: hypothetical protein VF198_10735 [Vicinamibacterales bacterium]